MFQIAEFVANVLVLGIGVCFCVIAIGLFFLIANDVYEKVIE